MKSFCTFLLFFVATSYSVAQTNYRNGYIITNENDTIVGLIDYRTEAMLAEKCTFKANELSSEQIFLPGQIAGFRFTDDGKFFVTREITINNSKRIVFLEFLVQGTLNLYYYDDSKTDLTYYFFEDKNGIMLEVSKQPNVWINNSQYKVDLRYRDRLKYIVRDVESLRKMTDKAEYNHKNMINITKTYHDKVCTTGEECIVFETTKTKRYTLKYGVYGGIFNLPYEPLHNAGWSIGGQLNLCNTRLTKSFSFQLDLGLSMMPSNTKEYNDFFFYTVIMSNKYTYHKGNVRPMVGLGLVFFGNLVGEDPLVWIGLNTSIGLNIRVIKEQFIFCSLEYNLSLPIGVKFPQLKVGYMF
ncbi:MAG: hypothetical protein FWH23_06410 [Bacteroidales bacterium]|nr:hypothetical protein [Bacteroidales bacterium]